MEAPDDPYVILGVQRGASVRELRRARNRLLLHWHPDRTRDPAAPQHAARINAAYEVLSDPDLRAAYDRGGHGGSLSSFLSRPRPDPWAPPTSDVVKAAAQQRVVDRFKDGPRPVRLAPRRWSDTVAPPASWREVRVRLLWRALPFALIAVASLVVLQRFDRTLPALVTAAAAYVPLYAATAALRSVTGRATTFGREGWGRFTLSWVVGVAAIVAAFRWMVPHLPASFSATVRWALPALLLLLASVTVYRITRAVRLPE